MIAFDPDLIDIKITSSQIKEEDLKDGKDYTQTTDWEMTIPTQKGTAYIRISPQLRDFFLQCQERHKVIGFEYDFEGAGLSFGVVLGEKN